MDTASRRTLISLPAGRPMLLKHVAGAQVSALAGCVWITQYGQARDIVLTAGEHAVLGLPTATVLSSTAGARLALTAPARPPAPAPLWRRALGWFDPRWSGAVGRQLCHRLPLPPTDAGHA